MSRRRVGILISGRGSNMDALLAAAESATCAFEPCVVISNRPDAAGLASAQAAGVATAGLDHCQYDDRQAFELALQNVLEDNAAELVACAGFMRIMTGSFIARWQGRMLNIHPSLLPLFKGLDTHARALEAGVRVHGCSVHFVSEELDAGAIIAQGVVPVKENDDEDRLAARVLKVEHRLYPRALDAVASGKVWLGDDGRSHFADPATAESLTHI